MQSGIAVRRVYAAPSEADGVRILVDRLWPRGFSKATAPWTEWRKELAPSDGIRKRYHADGDYARFRDAYFAELDVNPDAAAFRKRIRQEKGSITLLCAAKDETRSNASALRAWLTGGVA